MSTVKINNRILSAGYLNGRQILYFATNGVIFPISRRSCYSNGYWKDIYPWTDNTSWKD